VIKFSYFEKSKDDSLEDIYIYYDISYPSESYPYISASNKDVKWHWGGVRKLCSAQLLNKGSLELLLIKD